MTQSKRGRGKWNVKSKELADMKYLQFLIECLMRGIDLDKKEPPTTTFGLQSTVTKQIKLKLKVLFNATVKAAEESDDPDLKKSATKMKSNKLPLLREREKQRAN
jgi:hypothetical protein